MKEPEIMIKRVVLAVVSLAAGALVLAAPAFGAAAQASTSTSAATTVDWGPNHDGWHVHVTNDTRFVAQVSREPFDNVFHAPPQILPFTTATDIRGVKSIFGGPANMHVRYKLSGTQDSTGIPVDVAVFIRSDSSGRVSATCSVERLLGLKPKGYHCAVGPAVSNRPITMRFYTTVP
jgi:hypothetical protein